MMLGLQIWTEPEGPLRDPDDQAPEIETTCPRLSIGPSTDSLWCTMFQKQVMTSGASPAREISLQWQSQRIRCGASGFGF